MAQLTVKQLAVELKMPPEALLEQLKAAGVGARDEGERLSEQDKAQLLDYLRKQHGGAETKKKITITRKQTTEIKQAGAAGKPRTIQVEVRKKRTLVKREATPETPAAIEVPEEIIAAPEIEEAPELVLPVAAEVAVGPNGASAPATPASPPPPVM